MCHYRSAFAFTFFFKSQGHDICVLDCKADLYNREWNVQDTPCTNNGLQVVAVGLKNAEKDSDVVYYQQNKFVVPQQMDPAEIESPRRWQPDVVSFKAKLMN